MGEVLLNSLQVTEMASVSPLMMYVSLKSYSLQVPSRDPETSVLKSSPSTPAHMPGLFEPIFLSISFLCSLLQPSIFYSSIKKVANVQEMLQAAIV